MTALNKKRLLLPNTDLHCKGRIPRSNKLRPSQILPGNEVVKRLSGIPAHQEECVKNHVLMHTHTHTRAQTASPPIVHTHSSMIQ